MSWSSFLSCVRIQCDMTFITLLMSVSRNKDPTNTATRLHSLKQGVLQLYLITTRAIYYYVCIYMFAFTIEECY